MKSDIRLIIQRLIVISSFPPFTYFYKKVYGLAVVVATLLLRRMDGVLAIYLRRGMAKDEVLYGLSDIDLSVIIDNENRDRIAVKEAKERVIGTYNKLSRFIPLFIKDEEELGVYSASEFAELYRDYDFHRYRFNEGKHTWRLLYGKDVVKALPALPENELYLPATKELGVWWLLVNDELNSAHAHPLFKRKYLWYKAVAEVSRVYLFICHDENIQSREAALYRVKEYLDSEHVRYIDKAQGYLKKLTSREDLILDELVELLILLIGRSVREMERKVYKDAEVKEAMINAPDYQDLILEPDLLSFIEKLETYIREIEPYLDYAALIPQVEFSMDILANSDIDSLDLVLGLKEFVPFDKLRRLSSLFEGNGSSQCIEPFITDGAVALSLWSDRPERCLKSLKQCPEFFTLLPEETPRPFSLLAGRKQKQIWFALPLDFFQKTVARRVAKIEDVISDPQIYRMKDLDLLRFFWAASRTKLLAASLDNEEVRVPVTSRQILEALMEFSPKDEPWLSDLHVEYTRGLLGKESELYRYVSKSIEFLKGM